MPPRPGGGGTDAEHQHEHLVDVDAERIDHHGVLDAGAHDHADAGAIEHGVEREQRDGDDAEQREAIGRIEHEAERRDADQRRGRRHRLGQAAEEETHGLDEDDAEAEGDQKLVLVRTAIEVADDDTLDHHADDHDEDRTGDHGGDERAGVTERHPAGVATEHEHRAVRKIEDAESSVDDGQPR